MPLEFVEKDFWITEVLRSVTQPIGGARVVFKGGTSLSKAFGLLDRFSEDVDVLVCPDHGASKGSVDRVLKQLCERTANGLALADEAVKPRTAEKSVHRSVRYLYPTLSEPAVVQPGVLLELGIRGGHEPSVNRSVSSLIARYAIDHANVDPTEYEEFSPVDARVLAPERTLFEKLSLLHHLGATFPDSADDFRVNGRHLYDVHQLLHDEPTIAAIGAPGFSSEMAEAIRSNSEQWGFPFTARPDNGYGSSPVFDADDPCQHVLQEACALVAQLVYGPMPTMSECVAAVRAYADLL